MSTRTQSIDYISITFEEMRTLRNQFVNGSVELNDVGAPYTGNIVVTLSEYLNNTALNQVVVRVRCTTDNIKYGNLFVTYRKTRLPDNIVQQRSKFCMILPATKDIMVDDNWLYIHISGKQPDGNNIQDRYPDKGVYIKPTEFVYYKGFFMHMFGNDINDVISFACKTEHEQAGIYTEIGMFVILYAGINKLLLSNHGKHYQPGQQLSKASKLAVTRSLPNNVVLRPVSLDINGYLDDLRKQSDGVTGIVKEWHCAAWGVRGHYRHYKSGKVVFINPYTKGKLRNHGAPGREYDLHNCCK